MANEENLTKKGKARCLSSEEAQRLGRLGAKKREENKAKERIFAESIKQMLTDEDWAEIIENAIRRAKESDKGFEVVRDTLGQKPKEQVAIEQEKPFEIEVEIIR